MGRLYGGIKGYKGGYREVIGGICVLIEYLGGL